MVVIPTGGGPPLAAGVEGPAVVCPGSSTCLPCQRQQVLRLRVRAIRKSESQEKRADAPLRMTSLIGRMTTPAVAKRRSSRHQIPVGLFFRRGDTFRQAAAVVLSHTILPLQKFRDRLRLDPNLDPPQARQQQIHFLRESDLRTKIHARGLHHQLHLAAAALQQPPMFRQLGWRIIPAGAMYSRLLPNPSSGFKRNALPASARKSRARDFALHQHRLARSFPPDHVGNFAGRAVLLRQHDAASIPVAQPIGSARNKLRMFHCRRGFGHYNVVARKHSRREYPPSGRCAKSCNIEDSHGVDDSGRGRAQDLPHRQSRCAGLAGRFARKWRRANSSPSSALRAAASRRCSTFSAALRTPTRARHHRWRQLHRHVRLRPHPPAAHEDRIRLSEIQPAAHADRRRQHRDRARYRRRAP